jgi:hypothetical protein
MNVTKSTPATRTAAIVGYPGCWPDLAKGWGRGTEVRALPQTSAEWSEEINAAYEDAREALPFTPLVGVKAGPRDLFHLAPHVAIKFRGLPDSKRAAAVEAALTTYVASEGSAPLRNPRLAFALCYLASHFGLNLVSEQTVDEVMDHLMANGPRVSKGRRGSQARDGLPNKRMRRTRPAQAKKFRR